MASSQALHIVSAQTKAACCTTASGSLKVVPVASASLPSHSSLGIHAPGLGVFLGGRGDKNDSSPNYSQITSTAVQNEQETTVPAAAAAASRGLAPAARFQTVPVTPTGFSQEEKKNKTKRPSVGTASHKHEPVPRSPSARICFVYTFGWLSKWPLVRLTEFDGWAAANEKEGNPI